MTTVMILYLMCFVKTRKISKAQKIGACSTPLARLFNLHVSQTRYTGHTSPKHSYRFQLLNLI